MSQPAADVIKELNARITKLKQEMAVAKAWPARELREFCILVRQREKLLRARSQ